MRLPEVADRLRDIAIEEGLWELADLANEISRRRAKKVAPVKSVSVTPRVKDMIRHLNSAYPDMSQVEIAERLNVNPGRVSEVLYGKRK